MHRCRPENTIAPFPERHLLASSVHLGGRCEQHSRPVPLRGGEYMFRSVHVREEAAKRVLDDIPHADGSGEMKHERTFGDELIHKPLIEHAATDQFHPWISEGP